MLETERLTLRQMNMDDVNALAAVLGDPEAMRYYRAPFTRDKVEEWIQWSLKNYADFGYGLWAVVLKASQECIGDCGLTWQRVGYSEERQLEVGWHIRRDLWNRGLATEAGLACRDYARDVIRQPHLISIIDPDNLASQAVARKLGMEVEHEDMLDGHQRLVFGMALTPLQ
ncbi:MAG TPA: GNAT family N-acetyltransferase [Acidimicrobiales bacterium]